MSREIKFRAWDTIKNIFVDEGEITFYFYGDSYIEVYPNSITYIGDQVHNGEPERGRFTIQQYTGLKDENGVEIYEGDIVELPNDGFGNTIVFVIERLDTFFEDKGFRELELGINYKYIKVIGNIYENPNLLK